MKKFAFLALAAIVAFCSCVWDVAGETGNGVSVQTEITVTDFSAISVPSSIDVFYTQTPGGQSLTLTCDENLVEFYLIKVEDGTLVVTTKPGVSVRSKVKTYLTVNSPVLEAVKLSGSGDMHIGSPVTAIGSFEIKISGSGDVMAEDIIQCRSFSARTSGSGDAFVAGVLSATTAEFRSTGSGDLTSNGVTAEDVSVALFGSGDCTLNCKGVGTVSVKISGSGDCTLTGTAATLANIDISGSGDFNMRGLAVGQ